MGNALRRLVDDGVLSAEQRDAVLAAVAAEEAARPSPGKLRAEVAAYAGAVALAIAEAVSELSGGLGAAGFVLIVGAVLLAAGAIAMTRSPRRSD